MADAQKAEVHPDVQALIAAGRAAGSKPFQAMTPVQAREAYSARRELLQLPPDAVAERRDFSVAGPAGPIPLRSYRPQGAAADAVLPCLVYMHGGGWVFGDLVSHDALCCRLANGAGCAVIAIDYRLAPEHPFPAAIDDCAAALRAIAAEAASLRIDPERLAIGGDSAGGNLAAVLAQMGRDGSAPVPVVQLLIYPVVDIDKTLEDYGPDTAGMVISGATMVYFRDHYTPLAADRQDWRTSPQKRASLAGLAPAVVLTCGHDPLAPEGQRYAERLAEDGVRVTHLHLADQTHGMVTMTRAIRSATAVQDFLAAMLRDGLATAGPRP